MAFYYLPKNNCVISQAEPQTEIHSVWELRNWNRDCNTLKSNATFCLNLESGITLRLFLTNMETTVLDKDTQIKTEYVSLCATAFHLTKPNVAVKLNFKVGYLMGNLSCNQPSESSFSYNMSYQFSKEFAFPQNYFVTQIERTDGITNVTVIDKFIPISKTTGYNSEFPATTYFKQPDSFRFGISVRLLSLTQSGTPFEKEIIIANSIPRDLKLMLEETDNYSDLKIQTSDKIIVDVHKFVLAARSPVLRATIEKEIKKNTFNGVLELDIDSKTLENILKWMYGGELDENDESLLESILDAAVTYELTDLLINFDKKLIKICNVNNMLELMQTAKKYKLASAFKDISQFIKENLDKMVL